MAAQITSVTTTGVQGSYANINGSGFGASQGDSLLLFYPVEGAVAVITPESWSATQIVAVVPVTGNPDDLSLPAFFAVQIAGDKVGARSETFTMSEAPVPAPSVYEVGTVVYAPRGTTYEEGPM